MKKIKIEPKGFFNVLEGTTRSQVATMVLEPDSSTGGPNNLHKDSDQWLYVTQGSGEAVINGKKVKFEKGDLLLIEKGETHEIVNSGKKPLKTFNIYAPPEY